MEDFDPLIESPMRSKTGFAKTDAAIFHLPPWSSIRRDCQWPEINYGPLHIGGHIQIGMFQPAGQMGINIAAIPEIARGAVEGFYRDGHPV